MQKAKIQQQQLDFSSDGVPAFECLDRAPAQRQPEEAFDRAFPRRSKAPNPKFTVSKTIFPWMKECRHSEHKPDRRISGRAGSPPPPAHPASSPSAGASPTLASLGYVHVGGDYSLQASPPLKPPQPQLAYPAEFSKYPDPGLTRGPHFDAQYNSPGGGHLSGQYFSQQSCAPQDRILRAPRLTHL
ncbi:hypothetical protein FQA47_011702 [Oryzias melastigma]|uniref:Uncharacterized protein n=1 Tax=Oryzias melastigma TaxID=30732 RepID=A0A834C7R3_ORYME|nr:hypothetical protein FQA47_011702 [Oryzias melastigma]